MEVRFGTKVAPNGTNLGQIWPTLVPNLASLTSVYINPCSLPNSKRMPFAAVSVFLSKTPYTHIYDEINSMLFLQFVYYFYYTVEQIKPVEFNRTHFVNSFFGWKIIVKVNKNYCKVFITTTLLIIIVYIFLVINIFNRCDPLQHVIKMHNNVTVNNVLPHFNIVLYF